MEDKIKICCFWLLVEIFPSKACTHGSLPLAGCWPSWQTFIQPCSSMRLVHPPSTLATASAASSPVSVAKPLPWARLQLWLNSYILNRVSCIWSPSFCTRLHTYRSGSLAPFPNSNDSFLGLVFEESCLKLAFGYLIPSTCFPELYSPYF